MAIRRINPKKKLNLSIGDLELLSPKGHGSLFEEMNRAAQSGEIGKLTPEKLQKLLRKKPKKV